MSVVANIEHVTDLARVSDLRVSISASLNDAEVRDVAGQAGRLREWLKATKAAAALRAAAVQLEATALRRLALLWADAAGRPEGIHAATWKAARAFASLADDEFERLLESVVQSSSPGSLYGQVRAKFEAAERNRRRDEGFVAFVREVKDDDEYYDEMAARNLREAATTVIDALNLDGQAFTVAGAAVDLSAALSENVHMKDVADWENDDIQAVLRDVVRGAISLANDGVELDGIPSILTYHDADLGFVRIPRSAANLSHLLAMASFRRRQAEQAAAAADELEAIGSLLVNRLSPSEDYSVSLAEVARRPNAAPKMKKVA